MSLFYYSQEAPPYNTTAEAQIYAIRERLDTFFAKLFFGEDTTRVIWSDPEYSYRRRVEQLGEVNLATSYDALQLPFLSYYSGSGWIKDTRAGAKQLSSVAHKINWGLDNTGVEAQVVHVERDFEGVVIFSSMKDAEVAHSLLSWWQDRIYHDEYELLASNTKVLFPISMELKSYELDAGQYLDKWSKEQNLVAVRFVATVRTPLAKLPPDQPPIYITESVYWYFHNRTFTELEEMTSIPLDQSELFTIVASAEEVPPYTGLSSLANIELTVPSSTSAQFDWEYIGDVLPDSIKFYLHLGSEVREETITFEEGDTVETAITTQLFENLPDGRIFDALILVQYGTAINKYHFQISTPTIPSRRKGLAGLKGMTL